MLAVMAALRNSERVDSRGVTLLTVPAARLPKAVFQEESGRTVCSREHSAPLEIACAPLTASFGIFDS